MMELDAVVRRLELDALYADYAHCLDNDALEDWPGFFTEDCTYRITSAENFEAGLPLGIVYATSNGMLVDRVMALRKANIYEPQRYRHMIGAIKIGAEEDGALAVVANLVVVRIMQDGAMILFAVGRYIDRVVRRGDGWKFAKKDVVLDSRQIDTLLAIPL
jgi:3-phenylpropionate/cinnamic acid dioxygenase small subunit